MNALIVPQWPLPKGVAACSSTRIGGVSLPPYDSLNLGAHCGDNPEHVEENRKRLFAAGNLPSKPVWLEQVHGKKCVEAYRRTLCLQTCGCVLQQYARNRLRGNDGRLPACAIL